jgi:cytochrome c biogenesis protein CcmG/thiol:disulfide interchange protein DsbE
MEPHLVPGGRSSGKDEEERFAMRGTVKRTSTEGEPAADQRAASTPPPTRRSPVRLALQAAALTVVAGLLALLVWRVIASRRGSDLVSSVNGGALPVAPTFDLPLIWKQAPTWPASLDGALADGRVGLSELRGHVVVVNFWASWCVPCKKEAPLLAASARAHAGDVVFLGIDVQDFKTDARRFLERYGANFPSVRDGGGAMYSAYGLTGLPETYYLDRRGRIVAHDAGQVERADLERGIGAATHPATRR